MANTVDKVLSVALAEVGYLEKKSNSQLDSKTANAGSANYTKYGKYFGMNPAQWCDLFVDWCFVQAYGRETAKAMIGGGFSAYTPTSAQYYKNKGRWHTTPKVGDQIFFIKYLSSEKRTRICHTGLVYAVSGNKVYTYEGNTSGASGVISNGGGVCKKSYTIGDSYIAGYGRPTYDAASTDTGNTNNTVSTGGKYMFEVPNLVKGNKGDAVRLLQRLLIGHGYNVGSAGVDGDFGSATESAVKKFQTDKGVKVNYAGTVGSKTWSALIGV